MMARILIKHRSALVLGSNYWHQRWAVVVDEGIDLEHVPPGSNQYIESWHFTRIGALLRGLEVFLEKR